jgi:hypothetical protein
MDQKTLDRFWSKVNKTDGCWIWTARLDRDGYGRFHPTATTLVLCHRLSWKLNNGPIPIGMCVLHHCDNPACVNPAHLFLGTQADNIDDKVKKGRQSRGENHGRAKITEAQVIEARERHNQGDTFASLSREMGISYHTIWSVVTGRRWKYLGREGKLQ